MNPIETIEQKHRKKTTPKFNVGDIVKVSLKVIEGDKARTQVYEGIVIRRRGKGTSETFTVLKQSRGSSDTVEKTFSLHSPSVEKIKVVKSTKTRRAKLYYLRKQEQ